MTLHEGFLCTADEHVDIEVIYLLYTDGTLLHILLQWDFPGTASVLWPSCHWEWRAWVLLGWP